jgi:type VI secretion system protein ImpG
MKVSDLLNRYFERELSLIRRSGSEYKNKHTDAANSMHLNEKRYEDPNITRLLESVALLSAKNSMQLDQQLPHISNALSSVLYPSFNQLLPSVMSIKLDAEQDKFVEEIQLTNDQAFQITNDKGQECQFKLCNDSLLSPMALESVAAKYAPFPFDLPIKHDANAVIQLHLKTNNIEGEISELSPDNLQVYLNGFGQGSAGLIELMLSKLSFVCISDANFTTLNLLDKDSFLPRCIEPDFLVLDKKGNQFSAYQMMLEYFNYSEKRKYFHLKDFKEACQNIIGNEVVLSFFVKDIPSEYIGLFDHTVFQINTALVINQFSNRAEPINYNHQALSMPINPDASNQNTNIEVISVAEVSEVKPDGEYRLQPLFAKRYFDANNGLMWFSENHINQQKKFQHHLSISFAPYAQHDLHLGKEHLLAAELICCNGRAPCSVNAGKRLKVVGAIELPGHLVSHNIPSVPHYPNESEQLHWQLIELLSTNFSALLNVDNPTEKLRNLLSVFNRSSGQQVLTSAIQKVSYEQKVARMYIDGVNVFTSGTLIKLDISVFDKKNSMNIWLFIHLLNQFFACFCSFDRFIKLEVMLITSQGSELIEFDKYHGDQQCL